MTPASDNPDGVGGGVGKIIGRDNGYLTKIGEKVNFLQGSIEVVRF